ncbi:DUF3298 domain-containing protein [Helicobacter sp. 23-1044]
MRKIISFLILCAIIFVGCDKKAEDLGVDSAIMQDNFDFGALKVEAEAQNFDLSKITLKSTKDSNATPPQISKSLAKFYLLGGEIDGQQSTLYLKISSAPNENQNNSIAYISGKIVRGGEIFALKGEVAQNTTQNMAQDSNPIDSPQKARDSKVDSKDSKVDSKIDSQDLNANLANPQTIQLEITKDGANTAQDSNNQIAQIFEAQIAKNGEISGRFANNGFFKEGKSVDFKLATNKINEIAIFGVSVAQKHIGKDFDGTSKEFNFNASLQIPIIVSNKLNFTLDKINAQLRDITDFSEYANADDSFNFDGISNFNVAYIDEKVIVFSNYNYIYSGGAHGNYSDDAVAFDLSNGAQIANEPKILLKDENDAKLKTMIKERLSAEYGDSVDENAMLSKFKITPNGVEFYWGIYEIAPYAAGIISIYFDFAELAPFVREDSAYAYLFSKNS